MKFNGEQKHLILGKALRNYIIMNIDEVMNDKDDITMKQFMNVVICTIKAIEKDE